MSRVLLVNPPFYRFLGSHYNANSLGIAYIASHLNANGHDAWLYNADFVNKDSYNNLEGIFAQFSDLTAQGHQLDKKPWEYFYHQTGDLMVNDTISNDVLKQYLALNELNANKDVTGTTGYM